MTHPSLILIAKPSADDLEDAEAFEGDNFMWAVPCDGSPKGRKLHYCGNRI